MPSEAADVKDYRHTDHVKSVPSTPNREESEMTTTTTTTPAQTYWWCANCKEEVDPSRVTYQELHDTCGFPVAVIEAPSAETIDLRALVDYVNRTLVEAIGEGETNTLLRQGTPLLDKIQIINGVRLELINILDGIPQCSCPGDDYREACDIHGAVGRLRALEDIATAAGSELDDHLRAIADDIVRDGLADGIPAQDLALVAGRWGYGCPICQGSGTNYDAQYKPYPCRECGGEGPDAEYYAQRIKERLPQSARAEVDAALTADLSTALQTYRLAKRDLDVLLAAGGPMGRINVKWGPRIHGAQITFDKASEALARSADAELPDATCGDLRR